MRVALDGIGYVTLVAGWCRWLVAIIRGKGLLADKATFGLWGVASLVWALSAWLTHMWPAFWVQTGCVAVNAVMWWRAGGDDDWKRRKRKALDWAKSHLPRPVLVPVRAVGVPT